MNVKTYDSLLATVSALIGSNIGTAETARVNYYINRRARMAYDETAWWPRWLYVGQERVTTGTLVPFNQDGLPSIDTYLAIHYCKPYERQRAGRWTFNVENDGARLTGEAEAIPVNDADQTVCYVTYKADLSVNYGPAVTDSQDIPGEWFDYIAHGALADFLRADGQTEKAVVAGQEADTILQQQLEKVDIQGGQNMVTDIQTIGTLQTRNS